MSGGTEVAAEKKRLTVFLNKLDHGDGKMVLMSGTLSELQETCGKKFSITCKRLYTSNGALVTEDDMDLLRNDDLLFVSQGEPFFKSGNSEKVRAYKVAVLGSGGVGKSALTIRYTRSTFVDVYDPTIEDAFRHQTSIDNRTCVLDILDTAGQEEFKVLRRQWVEDREGFILVFSVDDRLTLENLTQFFELIETAKEGIYAPVVIAGNKADLPEHNASKDCPFVQTSARTGENVDELFAELVRLFRKREKKEKKSGGGCITL